MKVHELIAILRQLPADAELEYATIRLSWADLHRAFDGQTVRDAGRGLLAFRGDVMFIALPPTTSNPVRGEEVVTEDTDKAPALSVDVEGAGAASSAGEAA